MVLFQIFLQAVANALNLGNYQNAGYFLGFVTTIIGVIATSYWARGKTIIIALVSFFFVNFYVFLGWFDAWLLLMNVVIIAGFWADKLSGKVS